MQDREITQEVLKEGKPKVVIVGSFRFNRQINRVIERLEENGIDVLAPRKGRVVREEGGFKILDADEELTPRELEMDFLEKVRQADCIYFVNPGGYAGTASGFEFGWTGSSGKPVYAMREFDPSLSDGGPMWLMFELVPKVSVSELIQIIKSGQIKNFLDDILRNAI